MSPRKAKEDKAKLVALRVPTVLLTWADVHAAKTQRTRTQLVVDALQGLKDGLWTLPGPLAGTTLALLPAEAAGLRTRIAREFSGRIPPKGCWVRGDLDPSTKDTATIFINGKRYQAHRVSFAVFGQTELPNEWSVIQTCKNRACVNPAHLRVETPTGAFKKLPFEAQPFPGDLVASRKPKQIESVFVAGITGTAENKESTEITKNKENNK